MQNRSVNTVTPPSPAFANISGQFIPRRLQTRLAVTIAMRRDVRERRVLGVITSPNICGMFTGRISPSERSVLPLPLLVMGWHDYRIAGYILGGVNLLLLSGSSVGWVWEQGRERGRWFI